VGDDLQHQLTLLLRDWRGGNRAALDKLLPLVYNELHRIAHRYMQRERPGRTLQTTALVNEAYLRLIDAHQVDWKDRAHFLAISANLMRRILVELARSRGSRKRGGEVEKVEIDEACISEGGPGAELLALDDALGELAKVGPREAKIVELRMFAGLSVEETAEALGVSNKTVMREWDLAKIWLRHHLEPRK